jgi:protoporphyrinogen oxidase
MEEVVILGSGITGLSVAHKLCKGGAKVTVLEASAEIGGLAGSYKVGEYYIEKFYHHLFPTDSHFVEMAKDLGINDMITWHKSNTALYYDNQVYSFNGPMDLLKFKPLRFLDRIKFGINVLKLKYMDTKKLDKVPAPEWIKKEWGEEIYNKIFEPLLTTKFGKTLERTSAAFVHGRIFARAKSRQKGKEMLGYFKGGFHHFINKLAEEVRKSANVITNAKVKNVTKEKDGYLIEIESGGEQKEISAKKIVSTLPLNILAKVIDFEIENVNEIKYQSVICVLVGVKRKLTNYYWTILLNKEKSFGLLAEHTNFVSEKEYSDEHIIYLAKYMDQDDKYWNMSDEEVYSEWKSDFMKMTGAEETDILWYKVSRARDSTPIFDMDYEKKMPKCDSNGFYITGTFEIYPDSRNMNSLIRVGSETAKKVLTELNK